LLVVLFKNLAGKIAEIFNTQKDAQAFKKIVSDIATKNIKITESSPASSAILFIQKLMDSDVETLKQCANGYESKLDDNDINNYSKVFSKIVLSHLFDIFTEIKKDSLPKGNDLRRLQMWHLVDKSEIQSLKQPERLQDEKENIASPSSK
jgi:hypothetical protein